MNVVVGHAPSVAVVVIWIFAVVGCNAVRIAATGVAFSPDCLALGRTHRYPSVWQRFIRH